METPLNQQVRKIIHVDMDAFFASVEQRDNPAYRGKPVVVGGSPDQRGVVAAASYEARAFGIYSAMPSRTAIAKCPQVIFVRPRFEAYREASEIIREIFYQFTDLVEPLSLDEAYLDVTTNKPGIPSATLIAREIKKRIFAETALTASAGISVNKFLAKTASAVNKPDGMFLILPQDAEAFAEKLPIEKFYGIGDVTAQKMRDNGVYTGADLKRWSEADLLKKIWQSRQLLLSHSARPGRQAGHAQPHTQIDWCRRELCRGSYRATFDDSRPRRNRRKSQKTYREKSDQRPHYHTKSKIR